MTTDTNTIQNATVASKVNTGDAPTEVNAVTVEAANSEPTGIIQVQEECRSTDNSSEEVNSEVNATVQNEIKFHSSVLSIAKSYNAKETYTVKFMRVNRLSSSPVVIPFSKLEISKWNPSATRARKDEDIESLQKDIKERGLINPISIVKTVKEGEGATQFSVIAGAGRLAALKKLRGENSGLHEGEYKIVNRLDETNKKCAGYSLAENAKRKNHSDMVMALHLYKITTEQKFTDIKLAKDANMRRDKVNRLLKLGEHHDKLPESWARDLDFVESSNGKKGKKNSLPRITFAHWETVTRLVVEKGIDPEVHKLLTDTYEGKWKVTKLRKELKTRFPECKGKSKGRPGFGKKVGKDPAEGTAQEQDASPAEATKADPTQAVAEMVQALSDDKLELLRQYLASNKAA